MHTAAYTAENSNTVWIRLVALTPNLRGSLFMVIASAGFTANDALVKVLVGSINLGQVMLVRGLFATLLIAALAWSQGALRFPRQALHPMVAMRAMGELVGTIAFLAALAQIPLANVTAVMQALPLAVTMGAALFMGEMVGWRRWLAITVGFIGVMVIVRPGVEGFNAYSLLALVAVAACAVRDLATRRVPEEVPTLLISTVTAIIVTIVGALLIPFVGEWSPMDAVDIGLMAAAAILLLVGYQFIILSMRTGDISFAAPFRYTALLWAMLLGYLMFADVPDLLMIIGSAIVVASGLYTLYRERVVGRRRPAAESISPAMAPDGL